MIDNNCAARRQTNFTLKYRFNLAFNLVTREQGNLVFVEFHLALILGHNLLDEIQRLFVGVPVVDYDFTNIVSQVITNRTDDDVAFLINQEGGGFLRGFLNRAP